MEKSLISPNCDESGQHGQDQDHVKHLMATTDAKSSSIFFPVADYTPCRSQWRRAVDTGDSSGSALLRTEWIPLSASDYTVSSKGAVLLVAVPVAQAATNQIPVTRQASKRNGPGWFRPNP